MQTDQEYLKQAIDKINRMLLAKEEEWSVEDKTFDNFDSMQEFNGVSPVEFALMMCRLKMQRIKQRLYNNDDSTLSKDKSLQDSIEDMVGYGILALGIIEREKARATDKEITDRLSSGNFDGPISGNEASDYFRDVRFGYQEGYPSTKGCELPLHDN